jgi:hypothetical protein
MSWTRLVAIAIAVLASLLLHNVLEWEQGWAILCGLATLLVLYPVSIGVDRGLADKRYADQFLDKLRGDRPDD